MRALIVVTIVVAACLALPPGANAQPATDPHHPTSESEPSTIAPVSPPADAIAPGPAPGTVSSGMMGPDMMRMMGAGKGTESMMTMAGMMSGAAVDHLEGRLAFLKAELKITDKQDAQWNAFADAVRANGKAMSDMRTSMMANAAKTLPERLVLEEKAATSYVTAVKSMRTAFDKLYAVLASDQKTSADSIILGPMGMPMGMM